MRTLFIEKENNNNYVIYEKDNFNKEVIVLEQVQKTITIKDLYNLVIKKYNCKKLRFLF